MTDRPERENALAVLKELEARDSASKKARSTRLLSCLSEFPNGFTRGWFMAVPASFRQALDIRKDERVVETKDGKTKAMVWTQDCHFDFHRGDVLFDDESAYTARTWNDALDRVRWIFQVAEDASFFPGHVVADIFHVKAGDHRVCALGRETLPRFEFVRWLIEGPSEAVRKRKELENG